MKLQKKVGWAAVLFLFVGMIHMYSSNKVRVESGYSTRLFNQLSGFFRSIFGKIPFSFGDILYGLLVSWLIWKIACFLRLAFRKKPDISKKTYFSNAFLDVFIFCCSIYIVFNILWGINHNRKGIAWQLGLKMEKYDTKDVKEINGVLIEKLNTAKKTIIEKKIIYPSDKQLFEMVSDNYQKVSAKYPFLIYGQQSIKSSLWGWLINYTGITGYYNPFTFEAQVNTNVPKFLQPFIASHEVAHQLGYAKEKEANFVGYLAASNSGNTLFEYSVYLDLFIYANRNLYYSDSISAKIYREALSEDVIADLREWKAFNKKHRSIAEPVISWVYDKFLQNNEQPAGVLSYDEVTGFIIAYYKKHGQI